MAKSETLHVRVDPITKQNAENLLSLLGLSTSDAINIFLHQIVLRGGLPFSVTLPEPNEETIAAMIEAKDITSGKIKTKAYSSAKELFDELESEIDDAEA